jgi:hypothetical protein
LLAEARQTCNDPMPNKSYNNFPTGEFNSEDFVQEPEIIFETLQLQAFTAKHTKLKLICVLEKI